MAEVGLGITKQPEETWRQCVERVAGKYGLAQECLDAFDSYNEIGEDGQFDEADAAWCALYDWDCLDLVRMTEQENERAGQQEGESRK